jgi:hypothetical protein
MSSYELFLLLLSNDMNVLLSVVVVVVVVFSIALWMELVKAKRKIAELSEGTSFQKAYKALKEYGPEWTDQKIANSLDVSLRTVERYKPDEFKRG